MDYEAIVSWLEKKDVSAISKLSIYNVLRDQIKEEVLADVEISSLVDLIFDVWLKLEFNVDAEATALAVMQIGEPMRTLLRESRSVLEMQIEQQLERMGM